ncbi:MAG: M48 family metallopeptidase [Ignavibacteriales bacterium]|nr:M48 family metallopeptidase [Ignavibacteriales bacterium]
MSEPILTHARNIYEQQAHNRRMTWLLIIIFVLLIAVIGAGLDIFLTIDTPVRFIMLPFVLLMAGSGIWNFQQRAASGLWEESKKFADDDGEFKIIGWSLYLIIFTMIVILILFLLLPFYVMNPRPVDHLISGFLKNISEISKIPVLQYLPIGTTLAVIIGIVSILTSLRWGMNSVLWSVHAEQPDETFAALPELLNVVKEISLAAGIPSPKVYIVKDSDPNAFTIGTIPTESSIVVTTGLIAMLNREELQGVIAHEMSHIRNSDTRLLTIITVLFGAVLLLSEWMKKSAFLGGFAGSRVPGAGWMLRGVLFIGWLLTILFAPLIARIVAMAVSRQREYLADAGGAELTRNPKALANALKKIENADAPTISFQKGIAHLCVVDPLGRRINSKEGWWADLFATHPPMKNRIILLNAMAYEMMK